MLDFENFEVLTFDCYGTLIDWETGIIEALRPAFDRAVAGFEPDSVLEAYGTLEAEIEAGRYRPYRDVLMAVYAGLGERFGFAPADDEILDFSTSVRNWPAFQDSPEALAVLRGKFKLGILSNIDPARKLGLSTVWINRRHGAKGAGATPRSDARPHAEYPDLRSFADAACG
jgi:2-haloacid dehalogenase